MGLHLTVWGGFGIIRVDLRASWATCMVVGATFDSLGWICDVKSGL